MDSPPCLAPILGDNANLYGPIPPIAPESSSAPHEAVRHYGQTEWSGLDHLEASPPIFFNLLSEEHVLFLVFFLDLPFPVFTMRNMERTRLLLNACEGI
jgi:hypothetical protein